MVLSWFRSPEKSRDVNVLMARKEFTEAVAILRRQLQKDPGNTFMRQQLADALLGAGEKPMAVGILERLADDYAREGFAAKSISILKKIQRIDPGRPATERRLAEAIQAKQLDDERRSQLMRTRGRKLESLDEYVPPQARGGAPEEQDKGEEARREVPLPRNAPSPESAPGPAFAGPEELVIDFEDEGGMATADPATSHETEGGPAAANVITTPLFQSFSHEELVSVIQSFDLRSYEPGDIIVAEGEEGDSLFILTAGMVKAFVKNPKGRHRKVREMSDGDFFGEISFLKGGPRTATITAATHCDLLELSRSAVERLVEQHPKIRETLEEFSRLRQGSEAETTARAE